MNRDKLALMAIAQAKLDDATRDASLIGSSMMVVLKLCEAKLVTFLNSLENASPHVLLNLGYDVWRLVRCTHQLAEAAREFTSSGKSSSQCLIDSISRTISAEDKRLLVPCLDALATLDRLSEEILAIGRTATAILKQLRILMNRSSLPTDVLAEFDAVLNWPASK